MECLVCNRKLKFINNTHLKQHNMTIEEYKLMFNISKVVDEKLRFTRVNYCRGKSYEERFGKEVASRMKEIRKIKTTHQMTDFKQIQIRKKKCGNYKNPGLRKKRIKEAANRLETKIKRRISMHKLFEAGYMTSRFSKPAYEFIREYISNNNINEDKCYYLGGTNDREFFNIINKKYCFYDLVIFDDNKEINTIIEINGPWHYTKRDILNDPWSKATPYKNEKTTKYQSYVWDQLKLSRAKKISKNVKVYWLYSNILEIIK